MEFSWDADQIRDRINTYGPYSGALIQATRVAADASEIRVEMPLRVENANLVGTHFGGSLYAMVDPHLMVLLSARLGPEYTVWDKSASIEFVRPGRGTVSATVRITDPEVQAIREATEGGAKHFPEWTIEVVDEEGNVVCRVGKTLYVRRRPKEA